MSEELKKYLKALGNSPRTVVDSSEDELLSIAKRIFSSDLLNADWITCPSFTNDAAVLARSMMPSDYELTITGDTMVEGEDFEFKWMSPFEVGYKSVMVNLSDIVAMGAEPLGMIAQVGIPDSFPIIGVESFLEGIHEAALKNKIYLLGGDLSGSPFFFVSIAMLGKVKEGKALKRDGVQANHNIYVTGEPGAAKAGFEMLSKKHQNVSKDERELIWRFLRPNPSVELGLAIGASGKFGGVIDVSDGLARDVGRISKMNNLRAMIYAEKLPCSETLKNFWVSRGYNHYEKIMEGGEDFELLFSSAENDFKELKGTFDKEIFQIGQWISGEGVILVMPDGSEKDMTNRGFDHFERAK